MGFGWFCDGDKGVLPDELLPKTEKKPRSPKKIARSMKGIPNVTRILGCTELSDKNAMIETIRPIVAIANEAILNIGTPFFTSLYHCSNVIIALQ